MRRTEGTQPQPVENDGSWSAFSQSPTFSSPHLSAHASLASSFLLADRRGVQCPRNVRVEARFAQLCLLPFATRLLFFAALSSFLLASHPREKHAGTDLSNAQSRQRRGLFVADCATRSARASRGRSWLAQYSPSRLPPPPSKCANDRHRARTQSELSSRGDTRKPSSRPGSDASSVHRARQLFRRRWRRLRRRRRVPTARSGPPQTSSKALRSVCVRRNSSPPFL